MKQFSHLLASLLVIVLVTISCNNDSCEGVSCPEGFLCDEGVCVVDPSADPCIFIDCPEGWDCVGGVCVDPGTGMSSAPIVEVSGLITTSTNWSNTNIYELSGKVVVTEGATLTIEKGTIIKGKEGTGSLASALVITRGAKIIAEGTADEPIIFTSVLDNIQAGEKSGNSLTEFDNEKWGGLIILGNAPISAEEGDTESLIEGIPADDGFGLYGGSDPADNSGIISYVSVRHGGAEIGEGNEINGITFGGVGSGTIVNNIEVVGNLDDGVEFFGGTVNVTNVVVYFVGDDAIDIDQNYAGTIENFVIYQGDGIGTDEALEIDGPEGSLTDGLFTLNNGSIVSVDGAGLGADFKSKAQGTISNTAWIGYENFVKIRASFENNCQDDKTDAYTNVIDGKLQFVDCEIESASAGAIDITNVYTKSVDDADVECIVPTAHEEAVDAAVSTNNTIVGSATKGADMSVFMTWSWSGVNDKLQ